MATAKTGSFYLTETVTLAPGAVNGSRATGTIDLSAYVNVPTGQAIAIDEVDFIWQRDSDFGVSAGSMLAGNGALGSQLTDLNPGTAFVRADNQSLVASGALIIDFTNNVASHSTDMFPDNFGPSGLSDMFIVVNDQLYFTVGNDGGAVGGATIYGTVRIRARVVKLSTKDWMAVAIQSTAADN
tara:strand:- start:42 stop:593 length:552 start_codon:yes stop_codon:yes gene_type:complete